MVPRKEGLIVNVSSYGGVRYLFNVPYGVGKAAVDRMAADCGFELRKSNVAFVSLYPGAVRTELCLDIVNKIEQNATTEKPMTNKEKLVIITTFF
jgi:dehydrogenase/reductase SDR family member 1